MRRRGHRGPAGFTLLEILVVVAVIGTVVAMAVLSFNGGRARTLEREAQRLHTLLRLAVDEAVIRSQTLGLQIRTGGYRFYAGQRAADGHGWRPLRGHRFLGGHDLPSHIRLRLDGDRPPGRDDDTHGAPEPDLLVRPTGVLSPFTIRMASSRTDATWRLDGGLNGRLRLERTN